MLTLHSDCRGYMECMFVDELHMLTVFLGENGALSSKHADAIIGHF